MERNHLHQTHEQAIALSSKNKLFEKLEFYYKIISAIILSKQHPATGSYTISSLLPASTAVNTHGDYRDAWVRDNVYSILAVYGLALAYRRCDDDQGRTFELEHAVVKLMRGLLLSMMRQVHKVEMFKNKQSTENCLHAKYATATGDTVVGDREWGHLQLDATSIFVLSLAQMTSSGFHIVYTLDEVDFIQNLVFYMERAYRTPDYGIWERGNKINHGLPELNSSSIGMVVAALQAINGINLFGPRGGHSSVIHVLPDEITRNYTTLHSSLPRESLSKEVDAALLSIIGYPAFAVQDVDMMARTRQDIIQKLGGKYGCKRFLRDGHQTVLEDTRRLHYDPHELKVFEDIECEWPLFFTYLILDGLFRGDIEQIDLYREALKGCLVESSSVNTEFASGESSHETLGGRLTLTSSLTPASSKPNDHQMPIPSIPHGIMLVPELYIVPKENVDAEKANPHSQKRVPNDNIPLVWAQSLYLLGELLYEGLLAPAEIDPLGRYALPIIRSSQDKDTVIQVVLIAEDRNLQSKLATYGLETQTPDQVAPITIGAPSALRDAYTALGANSKLGLSGRPKRPVGSLGTCKLYRVQGRLYAFTPHFMDKEEFYMTMDNDYLGKFIFDEILYFLILVSLFEHELVFVKNHWWSTGRPTMVIYLTHTIMGAINSSNARTFEFKDPHDQLESPIYSPASKAFAMPTKQRKSLLSFIMSLRSGICAGVRVRLAKLQEIVPTSCVESLDFLTYKLEQGYLMKDNVKVSWQELLGGLRQAKRWDSNLYLPKSEIKTTGDIKRRNVQRTTFDKDQLSPLLSPIQYNEKLIPVVSLSPTGIPNSPSIIAGPRSSDYKLKGSFETETNLSDRPNSPLLFTKESTLVDSCGTKYVESPREQRNVDCLYITLGDPTHVSASIDFLGQSLNLYDQIDLLHYLVSCNGLDFVVKSKEIGEATVGALLQEVYLKASHGRHWSVVRQAAGLLKKVVNSLTINLTDLLIRQKQVTIGIGKKEYAVVSPLAPDALSNVIFSQCKSDVREAPLIQEILTYLGSFVRSEPQLFEGILRVRIHHILLAMRDEVSRIRGIDEHAAIEFIMRMSPSETKSLLGFVLSARDHTKHLESKVCYSEDNLPKYFEVKAQSAGFHDGNFANVSINGAKIIEKGDRGLNVIVICPDDGTVVECTSFDTHVSTEEADDFARLVDSYEVGIIMAIVVKDDAFENLTDKAKESLEHLGANFIRQCNPRDSYCLLGKKLTPSFTPIESHQPSQKGPIATIDAKIELDIPPDSNVEMRTLPNRGFWLRRRKIDGALQRSPIGFYPRVHKLLEKSANGLKIYGSILPRDPTISEKTPEELNFALQVENFFNVVHDPAERQIAVECLVVISEIEKRNPEVTLGGSSLVDIMEILKEAYIMWWNEWFLKEGHFRLHNENVTFNNTSEPQTPETLLKHYPFHEHKKHAQKLFFDLEQDGAGGTMSYLAKAALKVLPYSVSPKVGADDGTSKSGDCLQM